MVSILLVVVDGLKLIILAFLGLRGQGLLNSLVDERYATHAKLGSWWLLGT